MKRNFLRHICFALIAILLVTFTATAAVLQPEDEGAHRVKVKVPQFGIKLRLVACEDRYVNSLLIPSDMGYI